MSVMFKNELFKVEECSFVRHFLSYLNDGFPSMFSVCFGTVWTLLVSYYKLAFKSLLENCGCEGFLLDCELDSNSPRVRFGPYESCIDETYLFLSENQL